MLVYAQKGVSGESLDQPPIAEINSRNSQRSGVDHLRRDRRRWVRSICRLTTDKIEGRSAYRAAGSYPRF